VFRKLENASAPSFQRYVSILDTFTQVRRSAVRNVCLNEAPPLCRATPLLNAQTRSGVLALDFEGSDYICDLFSVLLDVAKCAPWCTLWLWFAQCAMCMGLHHWRT
jgi:ABC-type uncharacterized transport system permease subunit